MQATQISGQNGPLILGGSGRLGRLISRVWPRSGGEPVWQFRSQRDLGEPLRMDWDILAELAPALPRPVSGMIVLAGVVGNDVDRLEDNSRLALAACDLAAREGIERVLIASSQAVYGRASGTMAEGDAAKPDTPYGTSKLAMEQAVADRAGVTCLRIGNVVGADALSGAVARGPVTLDQFADGRGPRRMMISPVDLAAVLVGLLSVPEPLPKVLNVASPGIVDMTDILSAANATWTWRPAPEGALPTLAMDVSALDALVGQEHRTPEELVDQARSAGWGAKE